MSDQPGVALAKGVNTQRLGGSGSSSRLLDEPGRELAHMPMQEKTEEPGGTKPKEEEKKPDEPEKAEEEVEEGQSASPPPKRFKPAPGTAASPPHAGDSDVEYVSSLPGGSSVGANQSVGSPGPRIPLDLDGTERTASDLQNMTDQEFADWLKFDNAEAVLENVAAGDKP